MSPRLDFNFTRSLMSAVEVLHRQKKQTQWSKSQWIEKGRERGREREKGRIKAGSQTSNQKSDGWNVKWKKHKEKRNWPFYWWLNFVQQPIMWLNFIRLHEPETQCEVERMIETIGWVKRGERERERDIIIVTWFWLIQFTHSKYSPRCQSLWHPTGQIDILYDPLEVYITWRISGNTLRLKWTSGEFRLAVSKRCRR